MTTPSKHAVRKSLHVTSVSWYPSMQQWAAMGTADFRYNVVLMARPTTSRSPFWLGD
ncbi:MAG TPA: hypothetical protein VMB04_03960 [Mycobacterium sp.]|nr:hypothetical protein [Mycobacterium sp.]